VKRALIVLSVLLATAQMSYAQNIFDDEALEKPEVKPEKKPAKSSDDSEKPAAKPGKKRKKGKKKKKSAAKEASASNSGSYAPEDVARASYAWAPETEPVVISTLAPGMKGLPVKDSAKPVAVAMKPETIEEKPSSQGGGFKLPQIPLAQVLIVAGFVILFLIYRFRVGRQIKRKRY
jgi:hypothetical protein